MTKEEAKKEVARLLSDSYEFIRKAEELMDIHRFSTSFLDKDYCPRDLSRDEIQGREFPINPDYMSVGDGGQWMSSSDQC